MTGFIVFQSARAADSFTKELRSILTRSDDRVTRSAREPVFIFKDLTESELLRVRSTTIELGGRVQSAIRYAPL